MQSMGGFGRLQAWFAGKRLAAWVVSGVGLVLAGLSLWYLIVIKALYLGTAYDDGVVPLVLKVLEVGLLAGFSLVLVYAGYWLASSQIETRRLWWAGLWMMIGLTGVVALVAFTTSVKVAQGDPISEPTLIQEMLLAAGGGALAGLLIGVSTVRETVEGERAKQQRDTLLFVNELLRHNVLNGMQVIQGNSQLLEEHVDDDGERLIDVNQRRAASIVELIQNVRALMKSVSGETSLAPIELRPVVAQEVEALRASHQDATVEMDVPEGLVVRADELLGAVFENILDNAVEHHSTSPRSSPTREDAVEHHSTSPPPQAREDAAEHGSTSPRSAPPHEGADEHDDAEEPHVAVTAESNGDVVRVAVADDGPGMSAGDKDRYFESGERGEGSGGMGLGLYLVRTLVDRYGGSVHIEDNEPRGTVISVELQRSG